MKSRYLVSSAVAALLAGTLLAAAQGQRQPQGGGAERGEQGQEQRGQEQRGGEKSRTQGQRDQDQGKGQRSQGRDQDRNQGQTERQQGQREEGKSQTDQKQAPGKRQQGQSQQRNGAGGSATLTTGAGGSATLTTEHRTKIRQTVLEGNKAPRVSNVTFNVQVGTAVPRKGVRVVTLPRDIVEIYPSWRGFLYFVSLLSGN